MPHGLLLSECYYWKYSLLSHNNASHICLISVHHSFFFFTWAIFFVSVYQLFAELKQHNLLTFDLWHYKASCQKWRGLTNDTVWKNQFLTIILEVPCSNLNIDLTEFFRQRLLAKTTFWTNFLFLHVQLIHWLVN